MLWFFTPTPSQKEKKKTASRGDTMTQDEKRKVVGSGVTYGVEIGSNSMRRFVWFQRSNADKASPPRNV